MCSEGAREPICARSLLRRAERLDISSTRCSGGQADDWKPMPSIGRGVEEIRVRDATGAFRVIYTARLADAVLAGDGHAVGNDDQPRQYRSSQLRDRRIAVKISPAIE